jgi:peptide/nickel transport system substrate-binding protein
VSTKPPTLLTRRALLKSLALVAALPLATACAPSAPPPAKPTEAPKPAEAAKPAAPATAAPAAPAAQAQPTAAAAPATAVVAQAPATAVTKPVAQALRPPEPNPKRGGVLRMAVSVTTSNFDIQQGGSQSVLCQMYSNLVQWNLGDGLRSILPDLATRWETAPDGKTYTFFLRDGVKFHDGTPFSAQDVVATFNRIVKPPQGIFSVNQPLFAAVEKIEAVDNMTVKFTLNRPQPLFLQILADPYQIIYSKKALDENNQDLRKVIAPGTGPYKLKEHRVAEKWIFERNPDFYDKELPYADTQEWIHAPAWSDRGTAVLTGQADISWNVSAETWDEGATRKNDIGVNKLPNFGAYAVFFNTKKKPLDDPRVRKAIHLAVSKQDIIKAFQTQEAVNLTRWAAHGGTYATPPEEIVKLPGYRQDKTQDIEAAKKLMAEAGVPDGFSIELLSASLAPHAEVMAPAFQDQLKRTLKIDAKIRVVERALLVEEEKAGNFEMVLDTTGAILPDISLTGGVYWKTGSPRNVGSYSNPKFDALLSQYEVELDDAKRKSMVADLQNMLDEDPPWYLVGYTFHLPMWSTKLKGMAMDTRAFALWGRLETAWFG